MVKKTGQPRFRKVLRDNIQGLANPQYKRLARKAGVKRISRITYEELRGVTKVYMENIISAAVTRAEHGRRHTITYEDILGAIKDRTGKDFAYTHAQFGVKHKRC